MKTASCVGALYTMDGRYLRLLDGNGYNQPSENDLEVGQIWDIEFNESHHLTPPHIEDVLVTSRRLISGRDPSRTMLEIVEEIGVPIWEGNPENLFDGLLNWTENGSGFINKNNGISAHSVGFWLPDRKLTHSLYYKKDRYSYHGTMNRWYNITYVGYEKPIGIIPEGTLVRVSLARWWDRNGETEDRCSLQLSGWYDIQINDGQKLDLSSLFDI